jgi:hypothetical protein
VRYGTKVRLITKEAPNFRELYFLLPRTRVNRVALDALRAEDKCVLQHTVLYDTETPDST